MKNEPIEDALKSIVASHREISERLDKISNDIKLAETTLQKNNVHFPFDKEFGEGDYFISWGKYEKLGWRLMGWQADIEYRKPLIEMSMGEKIEFHAHLESFINQYRDFVIDVQSKKIFPEGK